MNNIIKITNMLPKDLQNKLIANIKKEMNKEDK